MWRARKPPPTTSSLTLTWYHPCHPRTNEHLYYIFIRHSTMNAASVPHPPTKDLPRPPQPQQRQRPPTQEGNHPHQPATNDLDLLTHQPHQNHNLPIIAITSMNNTIHATPSPRNCSSSLSIRFSSSSITSPICRRSARHCHASPAGTRGRPLSCAALARLAASRPGISELPA